MAWDDPIVWVLIITIVVFLFGANKIPGIARSIGEARREFDKGFRGEPPGATQVAASGSDSSSTPSSSYSLAPQANDPLIAAAQTEGIDTVGKTRQQIANELAWKLNKS